LCDTQWISWGKEESKMLAQVSISLSKCPALCGRKAQLGNMPARYTKNLMPLLDMGMPSRQLQQLEGGCDQCWDCLRTEPKIGQEPNLAILHGLGSGPRTRPNKFSWLWIQLKTRLEES
jgi:hypothetical protein